MLRIIFGFIFLALISISPNMVEAMEDKTYVLTYQKNNRWVAVNDAAPLRQLIKDAKAKKLKYFKVEVPKEGRKLSIARLVVLRDILEQQTKHGVIIEETEPYASKANSIVVKVATK